MNSSVVHPAITHIPTYALITEYIPTAHPKQRIIMIRFATRLYKYKMRFRRKKERRKRVLRSYVMPSALFALRFAERLIKNPLQPINSMHLFHQPHGCRILIVSIRNRTYPWSSLSQFQTAPRDPESIQTNLIANSIVLGRVEVGPQASIHSLIHSILLCR
jgi:hypothetical protein